MSVSKSTVVRLTAEAQDSLEEMLKELSQQEGPPKLNSSKLISHIVLDYRERHFDKNLEKIAALYRDKKKDAKEKIGTLSEAELESVIKFLDKIKKESGPLLTNG